MGRPKALVELDGEPLVVRALRALAEGGAAPLVVVLGARADEVRAVLPAGVRAVEAPDWADGMGASLRAGLAALEAPGRSPGRGNGRRRGRRAPGGPSGGDRGRRRPAGRRRGPRRTRPRGLRRAAGPPGTARARALGGCARRRGGRRRRARLPRRAARTSRSWSAATWPTPTTSTPRSSWRPSDPARRVAVITARRTVSCWPTSDEVAVTHAEVLGAMSCRPRESVRVRDPVGGHQRRHGRPVRLGDLAEGVARLNRHRVAATASR